MATSNITTSVPKIEFTPTGPVVPDTDAVLAGVQTDWKGALGQSLDVTDSTPQGQLITSETAIISDKDSQVLFLSNMFDPQSADGIWQDALAKLYFLDRKPAEPTLVNCLCVGLAGTAIPLSALVQSENGDLFMPVQAGTIPTGGQLTLQFRSVGTGPIPAPASSLTVIYKAIPGWDSVTNPLPGSLGREVEGRLEFEERRRNSVAKNGQGSVAAIYSEVANITGVQDAAVEENVGPDPAVINGVTIAGHSIYASAIGGADEDVAVAIFTKKSTGCGMTGSIETTVYYESPYGERIPYVVRFNRPTEIVFKVLVQMYVTSDTPANIIPLVQEACVKNFYGLAETCAQPRVRMGQTVYAARFYSSVVIAGAYDVVSIQVATETAPEWEDFVEFSLDRMPVLSAENVTVQILER